MNSPSAGTPSLRAARAKLHRAEYHLDILKAEIAIFRELNAPRITVDRDLERSAYVFKIWNVPSPDPGWGLIIGDCAHNARSALDHLAYQLVILSLGRSLSEPEARRIMFPICDCSTDFEKAGRRLQDLRPEDKTRIEKLQPYNAWDESIWGDHQMPGPPAPVSSYLNTLSSLNNTDKHRTIQPVWLAIDPFKQPAGAATLGITGSGVTGEPLHEGAEIAYWTFNGEPPPIPPEMDVQAYFPIQISLREPFFGTGVFRILGNCLTAVRMVLAMFEPCVAHGAPPAPLRYWDGPEWISG